MAEEHVTNLVRLTYDKRLVDGRFVVSGCYLTNIGYISIFFQSELLRATLPVIVENNIIDNAVSGYNDYGGIILKPNNTAGNFLVAPAVRHNRVILPLPANASEASTKYPNSVCIELRGASTGNVYDNYVQGGVIGGSFAKCNHAKGWGNHAVSCFYYGLEIADSNSYTVLSGNTSTGSTGINPGSCGLSISAGSNNSQIVGNAMYGNTQRIRITGDCSGTMDDFVALSGRLQ